MVLLVMLQRRQSWLDCWRRKFYSCFLLWQLIPANATTATIPHKISLNDKFCLINVILSDELTELALRSEGFTGSFPCDGTDGMSFADLINHFHPLSHQILLQWLHLIMVNSLQIN
jgi:hypothetical protein